MPHLITAESFAFWWVKVLRFGVLMKLACGHLPTNQPLLPKAEKSLYVYMYTLQTTGHQLIQ